VEAANEIDTEGCWVVAIVRGLNSTTGVPLITSMGTKRCGGPSLMVQLVEWNRWHYLQLQHIKERSIKFAQQTAHAVKIFNYQFRQNASVGSLTSRWVARCGEMGVAMAESQWWCVVFLPYQIKIFSLQAWDGCDRTGFEQWIELLSTSSWKNSGERITRNWEKKIQ
jgi:hypothetical protein